MNGWKKVTAAEVRRLCPGYVVYINYFDQHGVQYHLDCTVIQYGKVKKLRCTNPSAPGEIYPITRESSKRWYTISVNDLQKG